MFSLVPPAMASARLRRRTSPARRGYSKPLLAGLLLLCAPASAAFVQVAQQGVAEAAFPTGFGYDSLGAPIRIADTRPGATDPSTYAGRTLGAGSSLVVDLPSSVPADAGAVVAQLTAVSPTAGGYLAAYPAGATPPATANVDFAAGETVGNMVTVAVGTDPADGDPAVAVLDGAGSGATTNLTFDLYGYYAPQSSGSGAPYEALTPARIFDSRAGADDCVTSPCQGSGGTLGPGGSVDVPVTGIGGVPSSGVSAVVVNIAVADTTAQSYIEAYPAGSPPPASAPTVNENWLPGQVLSTKAVIGVGDGGAIVLHNAQGYADVVVDVDGYFGPGGASGDLFFPLSSPVRLCDTRIAEGCSGGVVGRQTSLTVGVGGTGAIPSSAVAGVLNVTDLPEGPNYLTTFPFGQAVPTAADINDAGTDPSVVANAAYAATGGGGQVGVFDSTSPANVVMDAFGYFAPAPVTPPALEVTTTSLTGAVQGTSYSAPLDATGGTPPYTWSLAGGALPSGLSLSPGGAISGTPTAQGTFDFTVQVVDSSSPTPDTATSVVSLTVSASASQTLQSPNWSGYAETGGPFTEVTGTFTVPDLGSYISGSTAAEWVGIDGFSNTSLIQAGIEEVPVTPTYYVVEPWWEILPAPSTPITSVSVAPGDQVTVTIASSGGSGWSITVTDDSNGGSFTTEQSYGGPAASAEWIVEAATALDGTQTALAPFSPDVVFSQLSVTGREAAVSRILMVQNGQQVSTPSALSSTGFDVGYGSSEPSAPQSRRSGTSVGSSFGGGPPTANLKSPPLYWGRPGT